MANNFFLNQDPLLYQQQSRDEGMRNQLAEALAQYQQFQQKNQQPQGYRDHLGELDEMTSGMGESLVSRLSENREYKRLSSELQGIIQRELMGSISVRINTNPDAVRNITRQKEIIRDMRDEADEEQRQNISELNDYVKNYSNITFEEYKRMKDGVKNEDKTK